MCAFAQLVYEVHIKKEKKKILGESLTPKYLI